MKTSQRRPGPQKYLSAEVLKTVADFIQCAGEFQSGRQLEIWTVKAG